MKRCRGILVVGCLALSAVAFGDDLKPEQSVTVSLQILPSNPQIGDSVRLKIMVENEGKKPVRLVRLRTGEFERHAGFFGWTVAVNGPGGKYTFIPIPIPRPPLRDTDIIELRPGESFGVRVDLTQVPLVKGGAPYEHLSQREGKYTVKVLYESDKQFFDPQYVKAEIKEVFLGPISSDVLEFEIKKKE